MARRIAVLLSLGIAVLVSALASPGPTEAQAAPRPDVLLIVVDDQPVTMLSRMPTLQAEFVDRGVTFRNAFATQALCCPARASILRGQYSHTTKIYGTLGPYGGYQKVRDFGVQSSTLATWLQDAGYRTGYVGKYTNGYAPANAAEVPPGWDTWAAHVSTSDAQAFYNYSMSVRVGGGPVNVVAHGSDPGDYATRVFTEHAVDFISSTPSAEPLFLAFAPTAPHKPATPDPRDAKAACSSHPQGPAFGEADVSDKPQWVAKLKWSAKLAKQMRSLWVKQCRSLIAVDRGIGEILDALDAEGRLDDTLVVYTSDNGFMHGEHRHEGKRAAYEGSIRLPFVLRHDGHLAPGVDDRLVLNIDIAPTILDAAGVSAPDPIPCLAPCVTTSIEGRSLLPGSGGSPPWRRDVLIEHFNAPGPGDGYVPTFCAVRTLTHKYVRHDPALDARPEELYDLVADPHELRNVVKVRAYEEVLDELRARLRELCSPPPPNYTFPSIPGPSIPGPSIPGPSIPGP